MLVLSVYIMSVHIAKRIHEPGRREATKETHWTIEVQLKLEHATGEIPYVNHSADIIHIHKYILQKISY